MFESPAPLRTRSPAPPTAENPQPTKSLSNGHSIAYLWAIVSIDIRIKPSNKTMNQQSFVRWLGAVGVAALVIGQTAPAAGADSRTAARLECFATSDLIRIFEDGSPTMKTGLSERVVAFIEPRRRGVEIASQLIASFHDYTIDPALLYQARRRAIEETLDLDRSPRLLLQTNPPEHASVAKGCAIEVHGWAEPGTILTINRQKVTVASDGLFLAHLPLPRDGTILLEAERAGAKKTLVRRFAILP